MIASPALTSTIGSLEDLYAAVAPLGIECGWHTKIAPLSATPRRTYHPAQWRYRDTHAGLEAAGRLVDTKFAERRNLILMNPSGDYGTAATLVSAYQMILPGEQARSHRHTPNALRLVLDAEPGVFTIVDGARLDMFPGDVVLTPNWCWHGHANEGDAPAYWVDYLDVPLVHALEPMFAEEFPGGYEPPVEIPQNSPYVYPWAETKAALDAASPEPTGRFGRQVALDRFPLKTMGLSMMALAGGRPTNEVLTTANNIYTIVEGHGRTIIDGTAFTWERGDVFVAPTWRAHHHEPDTDAIMFRVSDEPLLAALDWLRSK